MNADLLAPFDLTGRVALVTGGSGGIGRATVERLAAYGATVGLTCVEGVEDAATVRASFGKLPITVHPLDLRHAVSIRRCMACRRDLMATESTDSMGDRSDGGGGGG